MFYLKLPVQLQQGNMACSDRFSTATHEAIGGRLLLMTRWFLRLERVEGVFVEIDRMIHFITNTKQTLHREHLLLPYRYGRIYQPRRKLEGKNDLQQALSPPLFGLCGSLRRSGRFATRWYCATNRDSLLILSGRNSTVFCGTLSYPSMHENRTCP